MKIVLTELEKNLILKFTAVQTDDIPDCGLIKSISGELRKRVINSEGKDFTVIRQEHAVFLRAVVTAVLEGISSEYKEKAFDLPQFDVLTHLLYKLERKLVRVK